MYGFRWVERVGWQSHVQFHLVISEMFAFIHADIFLEIVTGILFLASAFVQGGYSRLGIFPPSTIFVLFDPYIFDL